MCNLKINLVIQCEEANSLQQFSSHKDFTVNEIDRQIEASKHLEVSYPRASRNSKTKKKRNFYEDLPMDLHVPEAAKECKPTENKDQQNVDERKSCQNDGNDDHKT